MKLGILGRRLVLPAALLAVGAVSSSWALIVDVPYLFPGVDSGGNLDDNLGAQGIFKANVNTSTGKFTGTGGATVTNASGKAQTYTNVPVNVPNATVTKSKYTVNKKGKAKATAQGIASN